MIATEIAYIAGKKIKHINVKDEKHRDIMLAFKLEWLTKKLSNL